jgi:hypothetical protein
MRTVDQLRQRVLDCWSRQWTSWLGGAGEWPKAFALEPPTQNDALGDWRAYSSWLNAWSGEKLNAAADTGELIFIEKAWSTMGKQQIPTHLSFANARQLATFLGSSYKDLYLRTDARWHERADAWSDLGDALRAHARWMADLAAIDYQRFISVVNWLSVNLDAELYLRQLPIAGVDTKWIERHAGPIAKLLGERFGRSGNIHAVAGLAVDPPRRRIRLLDERIRSHVAGISDISLRIDELATLQLPIRLALVVENQQTALACGDLPGTVVLMGGGFAVTELGNVPWLREIPILYWGDIDTAGFAILNALRKHHPHTESVLMDCKTFMQYKELWSDDAAPVTGFFDALNPAEESLRAMLVDSGRERGGVCIRLEQERLPWPDAWDIVKGAVGGSC